MAEMYLLALKAVDGQERWLRLQCCVDMAWEAACSTLACPSQLCICDDADCWVQGSRLNLPGMQLLEGGLKHFCSSIATHSET